MQSLALASADGRIWSENCSREQPSAFALSFSVWPLAAAFTASRAAFLMWDSDIKDSGEKAQIEDFVHPMAKSKRQSP